MRPDPEPEVHPRPPPVVDAVLDQSALTGKGYLTSDGDDTDDSSLLLRPNPEDEIPPQSQIVYDVARAARHSRDLEDQVRYVNERTKLQGDLVILKNKKKDPVTWTVTDLEDPKVFNRDDENKQEIGLTMSNFRKNEVSDGAGRNNR